MLILLLNFLHPSRVDGQVRRAQSAAWLAAAFLAVLGGCASDAADSKPADAAMGNDAPAYVIRYELIAEQDKLSLERGESAMLSVRLQTLQGAAVKGAAVSFSLSGQALDSSLDALSKTTDSKGVATNVVFGGARETSFVVSISAAEAESISVPVKVFPPGFGAIDVTATYAGRHTPALRKVSLYADLNCDSLDGETATTSNTSPGDSDGVSSFFLPEGKVYAAVAEVFGSDDATLASGCVDELTVFANRVTTAKVPYVDMALAVDGSFDLTVFLDGSDVGSTLGEAVGAGLSDRVAAAALLGSEDTAEAEFLLTALQRTLNNDPALLIEATSLSTELDSGSILTTLQNELDNAGRGPLVAAAALADVASGSLDRLTLDVGLSLSSLLGGPSVIWHSRSILGPSINNSLAAPSHTYLEWPQLVAEVSHNTESDALTLGEVQLYLPLTDLVDQAVHQAAAVGVDGMPSIASAMGCSILNSVWRKWANAQLSGSQCDSACEQAACDRAVANLLTAADTALNIGAASLIDLPNSTLDTELQMLSASDTGSDGVSLQVTDLESLSLSATWKSTEGFADATLDGSAEGKRNPVGP